MLFHEDLRALSFERADCERASSLRYIVDEDGCFSWVAVDAQSEIDVGIAWSRRTSAYDTSAYNSSAHNASAHNASWTPSFSPPRTWSHDRLWACEGCELDVSHLVLGTDPKEIFGDVFGVFDEDVHARIFFDLDQKRNIPTHTFSIDQHNRIRGIWDETKCRLLNFYFGQWIGRVARRFGKARWTGRRDLLSGSDISCLRLF